MSAETVLTMLAAQIDGGPLVLPITRREEVPEPPVVKVYSIWVTPEGLPAFPLAVDAFSLVEALELARKAAPLTPQVGTRPFTVSGRAA